MHFGEEYGITSAFAQRVKALDKTRVVELTHRGAGDHILKAIWASRNYK